MKTLTRQEIIALVKEKKLPPSVLKPYQEIEKKEEPSDEKKLIEAIYMLIADMAKKDNGKEILEAIKNQPKPEINVENIIEKEDIKPQEWQFDIERDNHNLISCIKAKPI